MPQPTEVRRKRNVGWLLLSGFFALLTLSGVAQFRHGVEPLTVAEVVATGAAAIIFWRKWQGIETRGQRSLGPMLLAAIFGFLTLLFGGLAVLVALGGTLTIYGIGLPIAFAIAAVFFWRRSTRR